MKEKFAVLKIFIRYSLILLAGLGNLFLFYAIFTPLTVYGVFYSLKLFAEVFLIGNFIILDTLVIELIPACIAGAAYYLLFILLMATPDLKISKRFIILLFSFAVLLLMNIIRIIFLVLISNSFYFEEIHLLFWQILSTIFIAVIWFACVKIFAIKKIPIYSDILFLSSLIKRKKSKRKKKN